MGKGCAGQTVPPSVSEVSTRRPRFRANRCKLRGVEKTLPARRCIVLKPQRANSGRWTPARAPPMLRGPEGPVSSAADLLYARGGYLMMSAMTVAMTMPMTMPVSIEPIVAMAVTTKVERAAEDRRANHDRGKRAKSMPVMAATSLSLIRE